MVANPAQKNEPSMAEVKQASTFAVFTEQTASPRERIEKFYGLGISIVFHILVVLVLVLLVFGSSSVQPLREIKVTVIEPVEMKPMEDFIPPDPRPIPDDVEIPDVASPDEAIAIPSVAPAEEADVLAVDTADMDDLRDYAVSFKSDAASPLVFQGLFAGRGEAGRAAGLARYADGKGNLTEAAVIKALEWLKNHQQPDGSWHGKRDRHAVAFTGLAVLTFLAHGDILGSEKYGETLQKGLRWLIDAQQADGSFAKDSYAHAIAAYAVSEGYALTQVPFLKESMEKAITVIVKGQQDHGSWTYSYAHNGRRDTSIAGWQVQALKAASSAGMNTPEVRECMRKAALGIKLQYYDLKKPAAGKLKIESLSSSAASAPPMGAFIYSANGNAQATGGGSVSMTAVGTLCLEFLGEGTSPEASGGRGYLCTTGCDWLKPGNWPLYRWYYTTQAIFQGQGVPGNQNGKADWKAWNNMFVKAFVNNQNPDGSWRSPAAGEDESWILDDSGSVYSTTLSALSLMVYYRILPSYQIPY